MKEQNRLLNCRWRVSPVLNFPQPRITTLHVGHFCCDSARCWQVLGWIFWRLTGLYLSPLPAFCPVQKHLRAGALQSPQLIPRIYLQGWSVLYSKLTVKNKSFQLSPGQKMSKVTEFLSSVELFSISSKSFSEYPFQLSTQWGASHLAFAIFSPSFWVINLSGEKPELFDRSKLANYGQRPPSHGVWERGTGHGNWTSQTRAIYNSERP